MSSDILGLSGKVALVWGGGYGMGERTSLRLAEVGAKVAVIDLDKDRAVAVASRIVAEGGTAVGLQANAMDEASVVAATDSAEAALGALDVMATVIGLGVWGPVIDMSLEKMEEAYRINLSSFFLAARTAARSLIRSGKPGSIACVSSVSGLTAAPNHAGYGVAKAGMINLVRTMANEWGQHGIRVNAAMPGSCATPRLNFPPEALADLKQKLPLGRPATPDEIAKGILFLLSDLASYITGHNLQIDGGWTSTFLTMAADRTAK